MIRIVRRLQRYIFRQLAGPFVFFLLSLTGVIWLTQSLRFVDLIINKGLSASYFAQLTLLVLPGVLTIILPIALFAAVLYVYNALDGDSEIVVMRSSGMGNLALARPALLLGLGVTLVGYFLSLYLMPTGQRAFKDMKTSLRTNLSYVLLQEGTFNTIGDSLTVYIRARHSDGEMLGILVHDSRVKERPVTMIAERGAMVRTAAGPRFIMVNGNRQEIDEEDGRLSLLYFDQYTFDIGNMGGETGERWREPRERYLNELFFPATSEKKLWNYQKLRMEGHHRLAMPLLPIAFTLIAIALLLSGEYNRRGQLLRILVAVAVVVAMEAALLGLKNMGERAPWVTPFMYLISIVPAAIAVYFIAPWRLRYRTVRNYIVGDRGRIPS